MTTIIRSLTVLFLSLAISVVLEAQSTLLDHSLCGTTPSAISLVQLENIREKAQSYIPEKELTTVPVTIHNIRQSNGLGGASQEEIDAALVLLNEKYLGAEIEFSACVVNTIDNDTYYDFSASQENMMTASFNIPNTINIYITNSVSTSNGTSVCGYTHFPWEAGDQIILAKSCYTNGSTLSHEMGHYLGLFHTHGKVNSSNTDELNSGVNCVFSGDDVCDTTADPNLFGKVADCAYTGTVLDSDGMAYNPDVNNIMSYSPAPCRTQLTEGQLYRAAYVLSTERNNLFCGGLSAEFTYDQNFSSCGEALTVTFTHTGTGATSWTWNFGDGFSITNQSPTIEHTYETEGTYSVSLTVGDGSDYVTKNIAQLIHIQKTSTENYLADFNDGLSDWAIENVDVDKNTWTPIFDFAYSDNTILCINNYTQNGQGKEDYLKSRNFDLTGWTSANVSFKLSYSPLYYTPDFYISDELEVQYSIDCGASYQTIYIKSGEELSTTSAITTGRWSPETDSDWRTEEIALPTELLGETIHFRIINRSGQGNFLYIDDFAVAQSVALPVELADFKVEKGKKGNLFLTWVTESELNTHSFDIEHSVEGESWKKVGEEQAVGTTNAKTEYSSTYVSSTQDNYFRLKMIDNDGSFEYSTVIFTESENLPIVSVFPNPTTDFLHISGLELEEDFGFILLDIKGNAIAQAQVQKGSSMRLDMTNFAKGIYILTSTKQGGFTQKIVKK